MGMQFITNFIKQHKLSYIIGVCFMLLSSFVQTLFPKVLGTTIDLLKTEHFSSSLVKMNILYILLIAIATFACTYFWRNLVIGNARKLECSLRESLYSHLQKLSSEFYNRRKTGDLIAYAINDISAVRMTFGPASAMVINGLVVCAISIYSMAIIINWRLTLLSLIPIPFIVFFMLGVGKMVQKRFRKVQEDFASISDRVQENIYGIRVIKAYVQEQGENKSFEVLNEQMMQSNLSMVRISAILSPIIELCFSVSFVLNLIVGGNMVLQGTITLGDFIAFNTYLTMIMAPVISIGRVITIFQRGMASLKRLDEIFDVVPEIVDGNNLEAPPLKGRIEFNHVSFVYPGSKDKVLSDINFTIPKGHTLGIVGRTGSGKSTLVNLLLKLYQIESGSIIIDNIDIQDYSLDTLRSSIGYVPQDNFLFSASIKDNITFFKTDYQDEDIMEATQNCCIYESIMDLPDQFDTILGERGVNLSGGQKQRISIARAIVKDPAILILDDALSAIDTITEAEILKRFKEIRQGKTTLIISHRVTAVENADTIITLEQGRIEEHGTHEELLQKRGLYYEIYMEQCKDREKRIEQEAV